MSRALRIGLIGAARVATYAIIEPARRLPGVTVAAVAARDPSRARAYAAEHGIGRAHESYTDLIADPEVDLVYIGTPPSVHAEQAMLAIAAGKPVLVEKPFALSAARAAEVFRASRAAKVAVFEAMHSPHHRLFARILEIVKGGEIGAVRHLHAEFSAPIAESAEEFRWNAGLGGGALMDLGVYPLAWVRRIAGNSFTVPRASAEFRSGVDAGFTARLEFATGVTAEIRSSMIADAPIALLRIEGTSGYLEVTNPLAPQLGHALRVTEGSGSRSEVVRGPSTYEAQLTAVRSTLMDGAPFPFAADDYVHSMEAIDRVRAAFPGDGL